VYLEAMAPLERAVDSTHQEAPAKSKSTQQTITEILALSIPALGSILADPVCSLVDTALVGQVSSLHLAALSPCTAIFNLAFLV
jgi:Na+-driven multidrug efflux pump